jgi:hypothetical protein
MDTKYYRVISSATLQRITLTGIHGDRINQRFSIDGSKVIVERKAGFAVNSRWMDWQTTILTIEGPEWTSNEDLIE